MAGDLGPWPVRVGWGLLPFTVGPALGDALSEHSLAVARTASLLAWALWAAGLLAVALPRTTSLTALRIGAPLVLATAVWAGLAGERHLSDALAVTWSAVLLVLVFDAALGDRYANGSAYGAERRMLIAAPTTLVLGPIPLTWAATVGGPILGVLLLAARQWVAGAIVLVVGLAVAVAGARALHGLSRRWVVFVPAGLVLHDLQVLAEPVLFPRTSIARLGPAVADGTEVVDLGVGTIGLQVQLDLAEPLTIGPRRGRKALNVVEVQRLLFVPTRPGALLKEAQERHIHVG